MLLIHTRDFLRDERVTRVGVGGTGYVAQTTENERTNVLARIINVSPRSITGNISDCKIIKITIDRQILNIYIICI